MWYSFYRFETPLEIEILSLGLEDWLRLLSADGAEDGSGCPAGKPSHPTSQSTTMCRAQLLDIIRRGELRPEATSGPQARQNVQIELSICGGSAFNKRASAAWAGLRAAGLSLMMLYMVLDDCATDGLHPFKYAPAELPCRGDWAS